MAYATIADLARTATGGWHELAQRAAAGDVAAGLLDGELLKVTAEGGDRSAWPVPALAAADAAVLLLNAVLERASKHADTYLFPRYRAALPLSAELLAGSDLPSVVAAIAFKRLYGANVPDEVRRGTDWADAYLVAISKGTVSLGALDTAVAQPAGSTVGRTSPKRFDWGAY